MRPCVLTLLLSFLLLWDGNEVLAASWLPAGKEAFVGHGEVLPLALRHRAQIDRQIEPALALPALAWRQRHEPGRHVLAERGEVHRAVGSALLYALKSLRW